VEIQPNAEPPVVKILDWGKYQYEQTKQRERQKKGGRTAEVKGVRLGLKTSPHDMEIKAKRAVEFLQKGHKVRVALILRGRENARPELGVEVLNRFIESLAPVGVREGVSGRAGREISQLITPAKDTSQQPADSS
jgi:translation initiation factor IF-3